MALYSLYCAEVPLRNCSLTHSLTCLPWVATRVGGLGDLDVEGWNPQSGPKSSGWTQPNTFLRSPFVLLDGWGNGSTAFPSTGLSSYLSRYHVSGLDGEFGSGDDSRRWNPDAWFQGGEFPCTTAMGPDDLVTIPRSGLSQLVSAGR